jgi:putative restriction endonuclease
VPGTDILKTFAAVRSGSRDGQRLPHKPLLLLLALGRWANGERAPVRYADVEEKLAALIRAYGPEGAGNPQEPFWRLRRDGLWELGGTEHLAAPAAAGPPGVVQLRRWVTGQFSEGVRKALATDPTLVSQLAHNLLDANFPPSLHPDIAAEVGLDLSQTRATGGIVARKKSRDPNFRDRVLKAYGDQCAVCGVRMQILRAPLGLEAAHVRWVAFDGPDDVTNGVALCALHHKAFDLGAFTIEPGGRLLISEYLTGDGTDVLLGGRSLYLRPTKVTADRPEPRHLEWHRGKVFKGRAQG